MTHLERIDECQIIQSNVVVIIFNLSKGLVMVLHEGIDLTILSLLNLVDLILSLELEILSNDLHFLFVFGMEFFCPSLKVCSVFCCFLVMFLNQVLDDVLVRELILLELNFEGALVFFQLFFLGEMLFLFERDGLFRVGLKMGDIVLIFVEKMFDLLLVDLCIFM